MTTNSALASQVLPVSILAGPSTRALLKDIVASDSKCRFGLLASANNDSDVTSGTQTIAEELVAEELAETNHHGGYNPAQVSAQIAAFAEKALVDHLIIECDSRTHPIAFASLFLPQGGDVQGLSELARLSSIVLSIDSEALLRSIVHGSRISGLTSPCILADQIEVANLVVLNGDPAGADFRLSRTIVSAINPRARIVQRSPETGPGKLLDAAISFDFAAASEGAGWRKVIEEESGARANDQNVTIFAYRARRPFHPEKFWNLLQSRFPGVFRAKGYFWLATKMNLVGGLNIAGSECHYAPAGEWWAAVAHRDGSGHLEIPDRLEKVWTEPFGDRRQAIAFMGIDVDPADLSAELDACLLNDSEMTAGEGSWAMLLDPFPAWSAKTHDHGCDDHDCCHHQ
jgi:G3E family GTPase